MKFVKLALVLAMALCLTASVYAETQSVKVSGDLTVRGLWRSDYDYRGGSPRDVMAVGGARNGLASDNLGMLNTQTLVNQANGADQSWFMSTAEVQVDADLTDNVATCIRILNERDWARTSKVIVQGTSLSPNGLGGYTPDAEDFNVQLDLAYVKLKNFIYSPLTVTIGRQDLWFGKGFIVGSNQVFNNYNNVNGVNGYQLSAPEYTAQTAFDSVKAVLDYDPWAITAVYSKLWENAIAADDDIDLYGVNVGYKFDNYKAEAEAYWFFKMDHNMETWASNKNSRNNDVQTIGMRGSFDPIDTVTVAGEGAYQFGSYSGNRSNNYQRTRSAFALDFAAEWRGLMDKCAWKPKVAAEYIVYSGDKYDEVNGGDVQQSGTYTGWDPMFRGKFDSAIREFVGTYYASYAYPVDINTRRSCQDASFTNQNQIMFSGSVTPMESLTLKGNVNMFTTFNDYAVPDPALPGKAFFRGGYIGTEFDGQAIWDYTEDVSFGVLYAFFVPGGDVYYGGNNDVATDFVGTVKVSF